MLALQQLKTGNDHWGLLLCACGCSRGVGWGGRNGNSCQRTAVLFIQLYAHRSGNLVALGGHKSAALPARAAWLDTVTIFRSLGIHAKLDSRSLI